MTVRSRSRTRRITAAITALLAVALVGCGSLATSGSTRHGTGAFAVPAGTHQPTETSTSPHSRKPERNPKATRPPGGPTGPTTVARVTRVVDGDTIHVSIRGQDFTVRYIGMDTPETVDPRQPVQWMGPQASRANERLVDGERVVLEKDVSETDRFGRLLRYVWLQTPDGWLLVNQRLVRRGYAHSSAYPPDVKYQDRFDRAERRARRDGIGLWGDEPSAPLPLFSTPQPTAASGQCHPSYVGACLRMDVEDYDCAGGGGNGPYYVRGPIRVVGPDDYELDNDGDGIACDS